MAVVNIPGWIGSSAVTETGQRWMTAARTELRLPASGWLSEMAGKSKEILITLNGSNNDFSSQWLVDHVAAAVSNNFTNQTIRILITSGTTLINPGSPDEEVIWIPAEWSACANIIIENHGRILGRGGNGGNSRSNGSWGTHGIQNDLGTKLIIRNYGIIAGGGGGGGAFYSGGFLSKDYGGGGGAPLGRGGSASGAGSAATVDAGGSGYSEAGRGGGWGQNGGSSTYAGGTAGMAVRNKAPTWEVRGTIHGSVP